MKILYPFFYIQYAIREWRIRLVGNIPDDFWNAINIGYFQMR